MNIMKCIDHVDVDRNWYLMVMRDHNGTGEKNLITFLLKVFFLKFFPILITLSHFGIPKHFWKNRKKFRLKKWQLSTEHKNFFLDIFLAFLTLNFQIYSNSLKKMAPLKKVLLIEFLHSWFQLSDIWREIRLYTEISKMKI